MWSIPILLSQKFCKIIGHKWQNYMQQLRARNRGAKSQRFLAQQQLRIILIHLFLCNAHSNNLLHQIIGNHSKSETKIIDIFWDRYFIFFVLLNESGVNFENIEKNIEINIEMINFLGINFPIRARKRMLAGYNHGDL